MELIQGMEPTARPASYTGVFPSQKIHAMTMSGEISSAGILDHAIEANQIQPASIDLRLGEVAYPVPASFLPGKGATVLEKMRQMDSDFERFAIDITKGAELKRGGLYVIPLLEGLRLKSEVAGIANPKSSTGRLDILTRLIGDRCTVFDQVDEGFKGSLFVEVAPRSFDIVVRTGTRLNQLRFRRTRGEMVKAITGADWKQLIAERQIVSADVTTERTGELPVTIDLRGSARRDEIIGWRARKHTNRIDLDRYDYDAFDYWEPIVRRKDSSLVLAPDEFYILVTREALAVPPDFAAEMLPYDTRAGEFRVHYAGFFDPGFGWEKSTGTAGSSRGVLEVRSHEVPFVLEHGQTVGWLRYERMAERPHALYGEDGTSHYQGQSLRLAKQFQVSESALGGVAKRARA